MIIGTYYDDGTPVESIDLTGKPRMFELEIVTIKHPRRYPKFDVEHESLSFCSTRESAEQFMKAFIESKNQFHEDIYCFYIYERVLDVVYCRDEYMSCWLYGPDGQMIDKRTFPSYWGEDGFIGRSKDEIRFEWGGMAELYTGNSVQLVFVLAPPRGKEHYIKKSEEHGEPYCGDISDDTYIIIDGPSYLYHDHVDALTLFRPRFPISKNLKRKYEKMWEGYLEDRRECYGDNIPEGAI